MGLTLELSSLKLVNVSGHLGCFCVLAIVNSAAVNTGVYCLFELRFSQGIASEKLLCNTGSLAWCSVMTSRGGGREARRGGDTCIHVAAVRCEAETNTTL